jgi:hypothetical protein
MSKDEEQSSFKDYLDELNKPHRKSILSKEDFYRRPRYNIIRPSDKTPIWFKRLSFFSLVGFAIFFLGSLIKNYIATKEEGMLFFIIVVISILLIIFLAATDKKSFRDDDK